jgi:hypothetical protein
VPARRPSGACGLAGVAWQSVQRFQRVGEIVANLDASTLQFASSSAVMLQRALPLVLGLGVPLIAPLAIYFVSPTIRVGRPEAVPTNIRRTGLGRLGDKRTGVSVA